MPYTRPHAANTLGCGKVAVASASAGYASEKGPLCREATSREREGPGRGSGRLISAPASESGSGATKEQKLSHEPDVSLL